MDGFRVIFKFPYFKFNTLHIVLNPVYQTEKGNKGMQDCRLSEASKEKTGGGGFGFK